MKKHTQKNKNKKNPTTSENYVKKRKMKGFRHLCSDMTYSFLSRREVLHKVKGKPKIEGTSRLGALKGDGL